MNEIFNKMLHDPAKMARINGNPLREAAFHAMREFVADGGNLLDVPWFAAIKSASINRNLKKAA